jgi:hypothetical protein
METRKQSKLDPLRRLIREEVISALRKELPVLLAEQFERQRILTESAPRPKKDIKESINKQLGSVSYSAPLTLNTRAPKVIPPNLGEKNPLQSLLNETAMAMTEEDDVALNTDDFGATPLNFMQPINPGVGSIQDTLATARPSSDISMVQINTVPDFSELMDSMLKKGII